MSIPPLGAPAPVPATADSPCSPQTPVVPGASLSLADFDYALPQSLIAQHPIEPRSASRLLQVDPGGALRDREMQALPELLAPGDLMIFNDTQVLKARLRGRKSTGGHVEVLIERLLAGNQALAQVRASHPPKTGASIALEDGTQLQVLGREGEFYRLQAPSAQAFADLLEHVGQLPLPPYIARQPQAADAARYQTVYAAHPGAVAAPTAGLHFDAPLLERLRLRGIETAFLTLHVGAGTFQPVRTLDLDQHRMHTELYEVPATLVDRIRRTRANGGRVVAVGTTTLRALESAALDGELRAGSGATALFIRPGFQFRVVDRLLTNFHLPRSTLMMLVSAFAGLDLIRRAYAHAVRERYRFFSYGDAMLLDRSEIES